MKFEDSINFTQFSGRDRIKADKVGDWNKSDFDKAWAINCDKAPSCLFYRLWLPLRVYSNPLAIKEGSASSVEFISKALNRWSQQKFRQNFDLFKNFSHDAREILRSLKNFSTGEVFQVSQNFACFEQNFTELQKFRFASKTILNLIVLLTKPEKPK